MDLYSYVSNISTCLLMMKISNQYLSILLSLTYFEFASEGALNLEDFEDVFEFAFLFVDVGSDFFDLVQTQAELFIIGVIGSSTLEQILQ